ncbi:sodium:solute symporter [Autumnicola musiva]|uniref:Sodium:solute symporter n=1 Tax=Autumnicola musiva TaxID=3075589 RepID=A0ABU3D811_9FLAO|nr:sodium:solute symporter [Zunongwangia sp. F117]MDT0677586.1 sodium:solute symporter [Zunongwangia sp. F117]
MSGATLHVIDYIIIAISLMISLAVGIKFSKKQKDTKQYFAAGGNIPSWAIGMSIFATLISSISFLAYPGEGYSSNWIRLVQGIMVPLVLLFLIGYIVPLYRKVIGLSAYEYFEKRFGYFARLYGSLAFVFATFSGMGTVFFLLSLALSSMTGFNILTIIWVVGIAVVFLTLLGGMEAVIWLDVIQGFLLIGGGIIAITVILLNTEGGFGTIWDTAMENEKIGLGPFNWDFVNLTFWVMAFNGIFYAIQKYGTDQTIVQRYLTAKTDKSAINASIFGVLMTLPAWTVFMFIGTALFAFYKATPLALPPDIRPDAVFPYFITTQLPPGLVGLIISALISAAISSLDSDLNCLSAVGVEDYYRRFKPHSTDADRVKMGKILVVLSGLIAIGIATIYVYTDDEGVLSIVFMLYAIFSGGLAGMFLLGLLVKRANKKGAYIGIITCILYTGYAILTSTTIGSGAEERLLLDLGSLNYTQHKYMLGVYSHLILFFVGWAASYLFPYQKVDNDLTFYGYLTRKRKGVI